MFCVALHMAQRCPSPDTATAVTGFSNTRCDQTGASASSISAAEALLVMAAAAAAACAATQAGKQARTHGSGGVLVCAACGIICLPWRRLGHIPSLHHTASTLRTELAEAEAAPLPAPCAAPGSCTRLPDVARMCTCTRHVCAAPRTFSSALPPHQLPTSCDACGVAVDPQRALLLAGWQECFFLSLSSLPQVHTVPLRQDLPCSS